MKSVTINDLTALKWIHSTRYIVNSSLEKAHSSLPKFAKIGQNLGTKAKKKKFEPTLPNFFVPHGHNPCAISMK